MWSDACSKDGPNGDMPIDKSAKMQFWKEFDSKANARPGFLETTSVSGYMTRPTDADRDERTEKEGKARAVFSSFGDLRPG